MRLAYLEVVRGLGGFSVAALLVLGTRPANATVMQPSGETMPQPASPAEISCCVTGRGFPNDADTLAGLFKYHMVGTVAGGDATLDPIKDAQITPGTFSPQCGLSGTIVLRGGGCKNALGWYNATVPATKPAQIFPLVPADLTQPYPNGISCHTNDFCPLATRTTTQTQNTWDDPLPEFAGNIRTDPHWTGGAIGFAMIGVPSSQCSQTKYTQAELNDKNSAGQPWVTTLIYQSIADPNAYYVAFEDQPTCTASWRGCNPGSSTQPLTSGGNDGDFNDFVFYVSGLSCKDGGKPCTVPGQMGICAGGVTECASGGMTTTCRQAVAAQPEVCDGVDNDCDGEVDNGATCPTAGFVCSQGVCVHPCNETSEFKCVPGLKCDTDGLCKDTRCVGKACGKDQICVAGTCIGGCDGVTCPHGQLCRIGNCVDACAGVTCPAGRVCEDGACQPPCGDCRDCAAGRSCSNLAANKGRCVETGCENKTCPAGQVCVAGACHDGCDGVTCPGGQACMMGACTPLPMPDAGAPPPPSDAGFTGIAGTGGGFLGSAGTTGSGASGGEAAGIGTGTGGTGAAGSVGQQQIGGVCKCDTAEGPGRGGVGLLLAAVGIALLRSRSSRLPLGKVRRIGG